jgi:hypothetical protein
MIHRKAGAGDTLTRYGSISPTAPRHGLARFQATFEATSDERMFPRERQTPEALGALQKADAEKWWPIIKELGIKAE